MPASLAQTSREQRAGRALCLEQLSSRQGGGLLLEGPELEASGISQAPRATDGFELQEADPVGAELPSPDPGWLMCPEYGLLFSLTPNSGQTRLTNRGAKQQPRVKAAVLGLPKATPFDQLLTW